MLRIALLFLVFFAAAVGFAWLADRPGLVTIRWDWLGSEIELSLLQAMIAIAVLVAAIMIVWWLIGAILRSPQSFGRWRAGRRRDKGYSALSRGLVAAGAGNAPLARRLTKDSSKLLSDEPLVAMLDAQTALLEGNRDEARSQFEAMLKNDDTRLLGLRGLYLEARKEGEEEAAAHFVEQAHATAPETPWAAEGLLRAQAASGQWEKALATLEKSRATALYEKEAYQRKRAVILTALAMHEEDSEPDKAKSHAIAAHKLTPGFAPPAILAARLSARLGDLKKAARILEATWKEAPHPQLAAAYIHLRAGDSTHDRLNRAKRLSAKRSSHVEGQFAIASAAIDAGEWDESRKALDGILRSQPSQRACLMMADLEEAENGDRGRVQEWLARAVHAPRDPAWTADGYVSEDWAPCSPVTGELDAFEWKVPVERIGGPVKAADYGQLEARTVHSAADHDDGEATTIQLAVAAGAAKAAEASVGAKDDAGDGKKTETSTAAAASELEEAEDNDIEDAVVVSESPKQTALAETDAEGQQLADPEKANGAAKPNGATEPKSQDAASKPGSSPYKNAELDTDNDGVPDRRPDDPGMDESKPRKKKNLFF